MEGVKKDIDTTNSNNLNNNVGDQDFINLKEIKKISENKEDIFNILSTIEFLEKDKSEENDSIYFNFKVDDNVKVFSILNIPQKMKKEEIIDHFKIRSEDLLRVFKKSLFWYIVLNNEHAAKELRIKLENSTFEKDSKLKFDILSKQNILDNIKKACHINTYQKETNDLKAENTNNQNNSNNTKWEKNTSSRHNSETLSWRKKSNDKSSNNGDQVYAPKKGSFFKVPYDKNFKRERFNSEGNNKIEKPGLYRNGRDSTFSSNPNLLSDRNFSSEIEIDSSKIKYSLTIKYSYTLSQSSKLLEKLISEGALDSKPDFKTKVDEITIENRKNVKIENLKENNPLNPLITSPISQNKFDVPIPNIEELNLNIPRNNPLANFKKPFNKFDEYDPSAL